MFGFGTTPVMFVGLLVLFCWSSAWSAYELTRPQDVRQRISNSLHLAMSVVMLLMVARPTWQVLTGAIPLPVLVGFFAVATGWFAWLAVDAGRTSDRPGLLHFLGHAAMFAAMTWHLAAMVAMSANMAHGAGGEEHGHGHTGGAEHSGGMGDWMSAQSQPGGVLWWFGVVGLPLMTYLLIASLRGLWLAVKPVVATNSTDHNGMAGHTPVASQAHSCHEVRPAGSVSYRLAALSDIAMNGGMFWMSVGLITPVLPFFAHLAL